MTPQSLTQIVVLVAGIIWLWFTIRHSSAIEGLPPSKQMVLGVLTYCGIASLIWLFSHLSIRAVLFSTSPVFFSIVAGILVSHKVPKDERKFMYKNALGRTSTFLIMIFGFLGAPALSRLLNLQINERSEALLQIFCMGIGWLALNCGILISLNRKPL